MPDSRSDYPTRPSSNNVDDKLDSWKEIASYLQRTVVTVQRWEKEEGLPVHRHLHNKQATVYASRSEIDTWLENRGKVLENDKPGGSRFFPEDKKTLAVVAGGVTLFLLLGLVAWMDIGSSSNPGGLSFQERDWVLIADFENRTGESVFDGVLEYALHREIANSQFVNVIRRERIEDTLQLMRKPVDTRIDSEIAREVSLRDGGIKALLTGRVEKLDSTYLLSIELVASSTGQTVAATSEEAAGQREVLTALRVLARWSRETLGERLSDIQASEERLEKVTTPSLQALQLFTKADTLIAQERSDLAEELLRQAIEIDPAFASAHMHLAHAIRNQLNPAEAYLPHAEQALQLAETAGDRERYFIEGGYYSMKGEREKAIRTYETLITLYPDHFWANNNLAGHYSSKGEWGKVLPYHLQQVELRPTHVLSYLTAVATLVRVDRNLLRAKPYLDRARNLLTPELIREANARELGTFFLPAYEAWLNGEPQTALLEIDNLLQTFERLGVSNHRVLALQDLYSALGKGQLARQWVANGVDGGRRQRILATLASWEGDDEATKDHLIQYLTRGTDTGYSPTSVLGACVGARTAFVLAQAGFLKESERMLTPLEEFLSTAPLFYRQCKAGALMTRGALELQKGNSRESIPLLEDVLDRGWNTYLSSRILAEAWSQEGQLEKAVQVLEEASTKKYLVLVGEPPILWLRLRLALAKLYKRAGRDEEAREVEEDLRKHLALSDPDHPILRQLDETKQLALRQAGN